MCRWQNGGFSLAKISPVERGIQLLFFFSFQLGFLLITMELWIFSLPCLTRNIGYKMFFHNKVVVPSGYGEKRSLSVFPFKCVYSRFGFPWGIVLSYSIIITKVRNAGYIVIWKLLNMFEPLGPFSVLGFLLVEEQLIHREQRKSIP